MVISHSVQAIFFENPRAASRSVRQWMFYNVDRQSKIKLPWHSFVAPKKRRKYFQFCVTRNPLSRLVSLYARTVLFRVKRGRLRYREMKKFSYKNFLREIIKAGKENRHGWGFFVPLRTRIKQARREMDMTLRFENLDEDIRRLPFWVDVPLLKRSDTEDRSPANLPWREFYQDKETVNLAIEHSWEDFIHDGYDMSIDF